MGNDAFYLRMRGLASRVLGKYGTGDLVLVRRQEAADDPDRPWAGGTPTESSTPLVGAAIPVEAKYIDGSLVLGTEKQVTVEHPGFEIDGTDGLRIDGELFTLVRILRRPEAGPAVAWTLFARA